MLGYVAGGGANSGGGRRCKHWPPGSDVATGGAGGGGQLPPWLWKMENSEICHLGENDTQLQCGFGF